MTTPLLHRQLEHAAIRLGVRLAELERQLASGDAHVWSEYATLAASLATILPALVPGHHGTLMTTKEMAAKLGVSPKTLLKHRADGHHQPLQLAKRGRAALRWRGDEVTR
jgi:FixJ family two-component response regulator